MISRFDSDAALVTNVSHALPDVTWLDLEARDVDGQVTTWTFEESLALALTNALVAHFQDQTVDMHGPPPQALQEAAQGRADAELALGVMEERCRGQEALLEQYAQTVSILQNAATREATALDRERQMFDAGQQALQHLAERHGEAQGHIQRLQEQMANPLRFVIPEPGNDQGADDGQQ